MDNEDLRLAVYRTFAAGRIPRITDLATELTALQSTVRAGLFSLANARHVVLDSEGEVVMAHPFSSIPLGFSVMGRSALWWGGCSWDSFAIPHLVPDQSPVLVATTCPACGTPHAWQVGVTEPPAGDQVAHFMLPTARMWDDVVRTCQNQRIYCSAGCVEDWVRATGSARGELLDLSTLWRLAAHWYDGRLDRGYRRREPGAAANYLASVGLTGAFWGA